MDSYYTSSNYINFYVYLLTEFIRTKFWTVLACSLSYSTALCLFFSLRVILILPCSLRSKRKKKRKGKKKQSVHRETSRKRGETGSLILPTRWRQDRCRRQPIEYSWASWGQSAGRVVLAAVTTEILMARIRIVMITAVPLYRADPFARCFHSPPPSSFLFFFFF